MKVGITGGIGSGKSYVCRLLQEQGISVYDCDAAAKRLMRTSPDIRRELIALIGPAAYNDKGLNKAAIAQFLLQSEQNAQAIDHIVHPAVSRDFEESGMQWMECAILYESGFDRLVDRVIAVTAPEEVRLNRIMARDGITREKAREWMGRQWPQAEVLSRADYEIVNDGQASLEQQISGIILSLAHDNVRTINRLNEKSTPRLID